MSVIMSTFNKYILILLTDPSPLLINRKTDHRDRSTFVSCCVWLRIQVTDLNGEK